MKGKRWLEQRLGPLISDLQAEWEAELVGKYGNAGKREGRTVEITAEERERRMVFAREKAATAWCTPAPEAKAMDTGLALAFADILVEEMYMPRLGCATTRDLLDELYARSDLDYVTVGG